MAGLRTAFLSAVLALFLQPLAAADSPSTIPLPRGVDMIVIPPDSPVRFTSMGKHGLAKFNGRFVLSGTYYYGDNEYNDGPEVYLTLYFVPDPQVAARLPYFKIRGRPNVIFITNSDDFVKAVIPKRTLGKLARKGSPHASGKVSIWADGLKTRIECDAPEYMAHFASVYKPATQLVAAYKPDVGC